MSYEDLEEERANHATKEKASISEVKRGRKRKSPVAKVDAGSLIPENKVARISEVLKLVEASVVLWRAPVARIY